MKEFYESACKLEEEKYDWEFKLRKLDFEVEPLISLFLTSNKFTFNHNLI